MWDLRDEQTPPGSPLRIAFQGRPIIPTSDVRKDRSSAYYKTLPRRRDVERTGSTEREHGWGSNAAAIGDATPADNLERPGLPTKPSGMSLQALIDPLDIQTSHPASSPSSSRSKKRSRARSSRFMRIWRVLVLCQTGLAEEAKQKKPKRSPDAANSAAKRLSEAEIQQGRQSREAFLAKRKARGSIMFEKETGIAQIPLYAAPASAEVGSAPALSSFAPRPPLKAKDHRKSMQSLFEKPAIAKASATIDKDGNILEMKKEKAFVRAKGNRYSAFVERRGSTTPTEPVPPLPRSPLSTRF